MKKENVKRTKKQSDSADGIGIIVCIFMLIIIGLMMVNMDMREHPQIVVKAEQVACMDDGVCYLND